MARLLLVLLAGVTALLLVGAESSPPGTLLVGAGGPWPGSPGSQHPPDTEDGLQPSDEDIMIIGRCSLCKLAVKALKHVVVNPKDKAGVARVTNRVCGKLKKGAKLCNRLLHRALASIVGALRHHQEPTRICTHLRWCAHSP